MIGGLVPRSLTSRLAALGLLAASVVLAWLLLVAPALTAREGLEQELRTSQAFRERFYAQAASSSNGRTQGAVLMAPTAAVAAAMLQTRLEGMIEDAGGTIERLEATSLPARRGSPRLDPVGARAGFTATTAQLRQILLAIETERAAMIVDEISVRAESPAGAMADSATSQERLRVEMAVRAFRLRRPAG